MAIVGAVLATILAMSVANAAPPVPTSQIAAETDKQLPCSLDAPCGLPEGRYMVKVPMGWDGKRPLAAAVWLQGDRQSVTGIMEDSELGRQFAREGILLIVPEARDQTWSVPGAPPQKTPRDETAFIGAVLMDAEKRFPIDKDHLIAAGFSIGATLVWTEACNVPKRFSAYIAFSGDFWDPPPKACAAGPVRLLQIHGNSDEIFPLHGRQLHGGKFTQGDAQKGLELWRAWKSCPLFAPAPAPVEGLTATATDTCADGSRFAFWQHGRGHEVDPAWVFAAIEWVKRGWDTPTH